MLLVDGVCILANFVIVNFIQVYLILWATFCRGVVATITAQMKDDLYYNEFSMDMFVPLVVKVSKCLH